MFDLDEAFEADPQGTTERVIAESAAIAAAEVARVQEQRFQAQHAEVIKGQIESSSLTARIRR